MIPFSLNDDELTIFFKVVKNRAFRDLTAEQWRAITLMISREVYDHHIEWCGHVHADGPEPQFNEPTNNVREVA